MTPPESKPAARRVTILVVEDEPVLLDLARMILERGGYGVLAAASHSEALAQWHKAGGKVDLLFTDMLLTEGGSGRELTDSFRREKSNLQVIFTSALAETEFEADLAAHPGSRFLQKPYSKVQLNHLVRECLEG